MADEGERPTGTGPRATRLAKASSSYLREAAGQPIDWHPWGPEPFELARRTNRPILLDVGAVWCHWCHVMDEGTYSDEEVARLIAQNFVAIKVDRDESPEVDRRYQRQVSVLSGQGGWPLTAFLTPAGEVFLGGTYFPAQDGLGRPGFRKVLKEVARIWREEPTKALGNVRAVSEALERTEDHRAHGTVASPPAFRARVLDEILQGYDPVNGGFGLAPKFPHPTAIALLEHVGFAEDDAASGARARETLLRMADGGIYDHLGGGFHRYAVDEGWHIPHFEKMGADNAALLQSYVDGARCFGEPRFEETVRGVLGWIESTLLDPDGGFGASQDADNAPGDDGSFFTWSRPELKAALSAEELRLISRYFGVGTEGRMPHDPERNVLFRLLPLSEAAHGLTEDMAVAARWLEGATAKLRVVRERRRAPFIDRALYADLNGSFIRATASAGQFLGDPRAVAWARAAADRFLSEAYEPSRGVAHQVTRDGPKGFGHLEDQAQFALGLLELSAVSAEPGYLRSAQAILELTHREFASDLGVLRDLAPRIYEGAPVGSLSSPSYPVEDNPHLSANAAVALADLRLAGLTGAEAPRERARSLLAALAPRVAGAGVFAAGTALAIAWLDTPAARVVVQGSGPEADALYRSAARAWHPNLAVFHGTPPVPFSLPGEVDDARPGAAPRALICFGTRCLAPVTDASEIAPRLRTEGAPPRA